MLEGLISLSQVSIFEVYSSDDAIQSCVDVESAIEGATEMIGLWKQEGGFQAVQ